MAALSSSAQAELSKIAPDLLKSVVELSLPGGVKRYVGIGCPVSSDSLGTFEGKADFGGAEVVHGAEDSTGALVPLQFDVVIEDMEPGHPLDAILYGASSGSVRGSAAQVRAVLGKAVPEAEWPPIALGLRIADFNSAGQFRWRFILRSDDAALQASRVPIEEISQPLFPAPGDMKLFGTPIPIVLGQWDSRDGTLPGQGPTGALPAYYVNNVASKYYALVSTGQIFHIERVFINGVLSPIAWERKTFLMPGFRPTMLFSGAQGRRMSFISFASDPGPDVAITWDGVGLTKSGIGATTGAPAVPMTNVIDQARWLANNVVLPATPWRDGDYEASDNALLDTASWDAAKTYAESRGIRGGIWLGSDFQDGLTLLNDLCASWAFQLTWTIAGQLAIKARDPSGHTVYYSGTSWFRAHEPDANPIVPVRPPQGEETAGELSAETYKIPAQSQARNIIRVGEYTASVRRPTQHMTARVGRSRTGTRRQWGAGYARFVRELLDDPRLCIFADALTGYADGSGDALTGDVYDGVAISRWNSVKYYGTFYHPQSGGGAARPLLKLAAVAGRPSAVFDGTDDGMAVGTSRGNIAPDAGFHLACVFKSTADGDANADATSYLNRAIIGDNGDGGLGHSAWGLHLQKTGGINYVQMVVQDSGGVKVAKVPISLNQWYVVSAGLLGGRLYCATNLFSPASTACGSIVANSTDVYIGRNYASTYWAGELYALIVQLDTDVAAQGTTAGFWGGGSFHLVHEALADLIRLPESQWAY